MIHTEDVLAWSSDMDRQAKTREERKYMRLKLANLRTQELIDRFPVEPKRALLTATEEKDHG